MIRGSCWDRSGSILQLFEGRGGIDSDQYANDSRVVLGSAWIDTGLVWLHDGIKSVVLSCHRGCLRFPDHCVSRQLSCGSVLNPSLTSPPNSTLLILIISRIVVSITRRLLSIWTRSNRHRNWVSITDTPTWSCLGIITINILNRPFILWYSALNVEVGA